MSAHIGSDPEGSRVTLDDPIPDHARELVVRVARLEGQLRGIGRMVLAGRSCLDVIQQIRAVQAAVRSARHLLARALIDRDLAAPGDAFLITLDVPNGTANETAESSGC